MQEKPKTILNCAIYTRVSTDSQVDVEFNSCESQEEKIKSFIKSQEGYNLFKVYSDPGYTGANLDRPGLKQMLCDMRSGQFNIILTYKIDRLTRSPKDFYQLIEYFDQHNVSFISITERFDTSTPSGRLLRNIMLTFAQFERELTSERLKDKFLEKALKGYPPGGMPPFGYKRNNKNYEIDEHQAKIVRFIYDIYIETKSLHKIVKLLREKKIYNRNDKPFANSTIYHLLRNPVLTGKVIHNEKVYPAQFPAIISDDMFKYVQTIHKNMDKDYTVKKDFQFAGLISCDECGSTMTSTYSDKKWKGKVTRYNYYRCSQAIHHGFNTCSVCNINADRFHNKIIDNLKRMSLDSEYIKNFVFAQKYLESGPKREGFEPEDKFPQLTAEKLQTSLKTFIKEYARLKGFDQSLVVRQAIKHITYGKKKIEVEWYYNRCSDDKLGDLSVGTGANAPAAQNFPLEAKTPCRSPNFVPLTATFKGETIRASEIAESSQTITVVFPNIAHDFWEDYRLHNK